MTVIFNYPFKLSVRYFFLKFDTYPEQRKDSPLQPDTNPHIIIPDLFYFPLSVDGEGEEEGNDQHPDHTNTTDPAANAGRRA